MPKKIPPEQKSPGKELKEIQEKLVDFSKRKVPPLAIAAKYMEDMILGISNKKHANARSLKRGCKYYLVDGMPFYLYEDLVEYYTRHPVKTSGGANND